MRRRNLYGHGCSAARRAGDRDAPAEQPRALSHAEQSDRLDARELGLRDAASVVLHVSVSILPRSRRLMRTAPAWACRDDVGQRLLQNAEQRQLPRAIGRSRPSAPHVTRQRMPVRA